MSDRLAEIQAAWAEAEIDVWFSTDDVLWLVAALVAERAENERLRNSHEVLWQANAVKAQLDAERALADALAAALEELATSIRVKGTAWSCWDALAAYRSARAGEE